MAGAVSRGTKPVAGGRAPAVAALLALLRAAPLASAQEGPIQDNSFLIEEAYNQDPGVVQHISSYSRFASSGDWIYTFTQEWPLRGLKHQVSYSLPVQDLHSQLAAAVGIGDVAINYRYQAIGNAQGIWPSRRGSACWCRPGSPTRASEPAGWACS